MKIPVQELSCPFCCTVEPKTRYSFENCAILRCPACDLMWLHPKPSIDQLHKIYDDNYYSNHDFFRKDGTKLYGYVDYLAERINKQYEYQIIVGDVKEMLLQENANADMIGRKWLDVGCGLGFLMDVAFDKGFSVTGVEFNRAAIKYIRSKYTFPVRYGLLRELDFTEEYDVISIFDVIEHLDDPVETLKILRGIVKANGYCLIQTMDSDSFVSRLIGKRLEDFRRTREHLFFFTRNSIRTVLDYCGWQVCKIHSIGHTFQISELINRISVYGPSLSKVLRSCIYPRWLLNANIYVNPGTKMLVYARPKQIQ